MPNPVMEATVRGLNRGSGGTPWKGAKFMVRRAMTRAVAARITTLMMMPVAVRSRAEMRTVVSAASGSFGLTWDQA